MPNIVYVLTNPAMPGLVKIGMTDRDDVQQRMNDLFTTGVPFPFECVMAKEVEGMTAGQVESALHRAFAPNRTNPNREFFKIDTEQAAAILRLLPGKDVTPRTREQEDAALEDDKLAATEFVKQRERTSEIDFLAAHKGNARELYQRVLALGKYDGMQITWARTSFGLWVLCDDVRYQLCWGNQPEAYYGRLYTYLIELKRNEIVPLEEIEAFRKEALASELFKPAGNQGEVSVHIDREYTEAEIDTIISSLWALVELIRTHTGAKAAEA